MIRRCMYFFLALISPAAAQAPPPAVTEVWEARWFNPKPAEGDVVLPLPCGGAMTFRPVLVPVAAGPLTDRAVTLGEAQTTQGYIDFQRGAYLAAPFDAGPSARQFLIGKYDVTRDQYAAITTQACPVPSPGGRVPQAAISWLDAVAASAQLTTWWLTHAKDKLPRRGDLYAYARLPTEDEWEFAARGGAAVSEAEFLGRTWPMPEGIEAYAMAGSRNAAGRAQQIGQLKPNPLGLYDMLGNVQQMMLDAFRMNRVGRLHGQAGGIVARGGDYTSPPAGLETATRVEIKPFDERTGKPTTLPTMGFRLVLSAPAVGSIQEAEAARQAFDTESGQQITLANDPAHLLATLRDSAGSEAVRRGIDQVRARLADQGRDRADRERVAVSAQLEAAAVMANFIWNLDNVSRVFDRLADGLNEPRFRDLAQLRRVQIDPTLDGYLRLVRGLALSPEAAQIEAQSGVLDQELTARRQAQLHALLAIATRHATMRRDTKPLPRERALADILAVQLATPAAPQP